LWPRGKTSQKDYEVRSEEVWSQQEILPVINQRAIRVPGTALALAFGRQKFHMGIEEKKQRDRSLCLHFLFTVLIRTDCFRNQVLSG
jgi:hypothetical protein